MRRKLGGAATLVAALAFASPAVADSAKSVTATGTVLVRVVPADRHSNSSIAAAVAAARAGGVGRALAQARANAVAYARAVGLTLGPVLSVSDVAAANSGIGYPFGFVGPFSANQYCGTITTARVKVIDHKRKVVSHRRVYRCFIPPNEATTLTVTYAAT